MTIIIPPDGSVRMIYGDELAGLAGEGTAVTARASHVEPCDGGWTADMAPVGGPKLGPFLLRKDALEEEVAWLERHGVPAPLQCCGT